MGTLQAAGFALVSAGLFIAEPSRAACIKPEIPACAVQKGPFPKDIDADNCRKDMIAYKGGMEAYSSCLGEGQPQEKQSAGAELESALAQYNRRARGESD